MSSSWIAKIDPEPYETVELIVSGIIPLIFLVIGTFGNLLCIIILLKKEHRQTSTNIYLIFLCIMDTISLYQWNLSYIVFMFTDGKNQVSNQSLFLCKASEFFAFYTLHTSAMFLTLVSVDRACLLWSRRYKRKIARPRVALILCIIILVVLVGLDGFLFELGLEYTIYDNSTGKEVTVVGCYYSYNANLNQFFNDQYAWIHLVMMYLIPFTFMLLCTIFTAKKLIVRQTSDNQQLTISARRNRRISIMLLLMCLAYVVLTLPNRLCFSAFPNQIIGHDYTDIVFLTSNTLMYTRSALNVFFLYLSVHGFRRDVRQLMLKCCGKITGRVAPDEDTGGEHPGTITTLRNPAISRKTQALTQAH